MSEFLYHKCPGQVYFVIFIQTILIAKLYISNSNRSMSSTLWLFFL